MTALTQETRERLERIAASFDYKAAAEVSRFVREQHEDTADFLRDLAKPPEPTTGEQVGDEATALAFAEIKGKGTIYEEDIARALQAAAPAIEAPPRERLAEVEAELKRLQGPPCEYCNGQGWVEGWADHTTPDGEYIGSEPIQQECPSCEGSGHIDPARAALAAFEQALKSDAAQAALSSALAEAGVETGPIKGIWADQAKAGIDALLQAAHHELKEKEDGS